jgi:hypothetical protein
MVVLVTKDRGARQRLTGFVDDLTVYTEGLILGKAGKREKKERGSTERRAVVGSWISF